MITIPIPDKWVRKMISEAIAAVDPLLPVYDSRTTQNVPGVYVLMSTQTTNVDPFSKCGDRWLHTIQLDCVVRLPAVSNPGSRRDVDDVAELVRTALQNVQLDPASGLTLHRYNITLPFDSVVDLEDFIITQKSLQFECVIN